MATIKIGILGTISGKIGGLVFYTYSGKQMVRSMPRKSRKAPTDAQLKQRMRLGMMAGFFNGLRPLISRGFGTNACMSYNLKNAIVGTYPHLEIDYNKVVLTRGKLAGASATVTSNGGFVWRNTANYFNSFPDDKAILIAYNPKNNQHKYTVTNVTREAGSAGLDLFGCFPGDRLCCWIAFISSDGKQFSPSRYLGMVIVPD